MGDLIPTPWTFGWNKLVYDDDYGYNFCVADKHILFYKAADWKNERFIVNVDTGNGNSAYNTDN